MRLDSDREARAHEAAMEARDPVLCCGVAMVVETRGAGSVDGGTVWHQCLTCAGCRRQVERDLGEGAGALAFVALCEGLQLRHFRADPDDYTRHEFWISYTSYGREYALQEALKCGYGHDPVAGAAVQ